LTLYISSHGTPDLGDFVERVRGHKEFGLEFSGGQWTGSEEDILEFCYERNFPVRLHNYFPPSKTPFVLNLASQNEQIRGESIDHASRAISLSRKYGASYYAVHCGFLFDPKVNELGRQIRESEIQPIEESLERFVQSILTLNATAQNEGVELAIENNVYSTALHGGFKQVPFLGVHPSQILRISAETGVGLLLDVGHLKVSSKSLDLNWSESMELLKPITTGLHLSGNNGLKDEHALLDAEADVIQFLKSWDHVTHVTTEFANPASIASLEAASRISWELLSE
jgi:sugar phosphate isomerase/epimerase